MIKLDYQDSSEGMAQHVHGFHKKDMIVLHETVSPDEKGFLDIDGVLAGLAARDYGIHGLTDLEGNVAWAFGLGKAIFWQAGGVNERSIGIEQISLVMLQHSTNAGRRAAWALRDKQLATTAKLIACISRAQGVPIVVSDGLHPGVTSHWNVSQHYAASEGHTDCWPINYGGYYPLGSVVTAAKKYYRLGYHF